MIRSRVVLIILAAIASTTNTQAIDWTFWNDDDDSSPSPATSDTTYTETLSPETLNNMMGSDYLDRVKSLIYSGKGFGFRSAYFYIFVVCLVAGYGR
ncbi:hypothetical protein GN958_ATG02076 [Phytophthora infestans]|uniref:Secreted RxLR effector peptide protein n=1 Tax=Phytophthora infestans TaxID=4787 RepID=A0A8S9V6V5_PHYIN|nr:hypothetical protein GN958_ATG02076 [Phytophthora infestans]